MSNDKTIDILIILNAIAFGLNLFFFIIKIKNYVQAQKHKNKKKKHLHDQSWRNPSLEQFEKMKEFLNQKPKKQ